MTRNTDAGTVKGLLQSLEHILDSVDRTSGFACDLRYEQHLDELAKYREHLRTLIAKWWTLGEDVSQYSVRNRLVFRTDFPLVPVCVNQLILELARPDGHLTQKTSR
jgi:hypothetical protein